nr:uncharacterized protein LOC113806272 [Penaeus vannamei]
MVGTHRGAMKVLLLLTVAAVALGDDLQRTAILMYNIPATQSSQMPRTLQVDEDRGDSEYHFAWLHDGGRTYDWQGANSYCSSLGRGWKGISIETRERTTSSPIKTLASLSDELPWVWTGGQRRGRDFVWPSGARFVGLNWSHTGGKEELSIFSTLLIPLLLAGRKKQPQPDNREQGGENCVAVLNDFYDDGVRWHDIACHHEKSIICERDD